MSGNMHGTGSFKTCYNLVVTKETKLRLKRLANFRPVSIFPFISKIFREDSVATIAEFSGGKKVFKLFQSGFKKYNSTETALLKVLNNLLISGGSGDCTLLELLDLSAAFYSVDHAILLARLEHCVGIKGAALEWFRSYLSNRKFSVNIV